MNIPKATTLFVIVAAVGLIVALANPAPARGTPSPERGQPPDGFTEVIVTFFDDPDDLELEDIEELGGTIRYVYHLIPAIAATVPISALTELEEDAGIERIEPDLLIFADPAPNDPEYGNQWALNNEGQTGGTPDADIDAPEAWAITTGSASVVIAVVDTGAQVAPGFSGSVSTHPDLATNLWVNPGEIPGDGIDNDLNGYVDDIHGWNFYDGESWLFYSVAEDEHGTHVGGTIASTGNNGTGVTGVNWQAQLMILKFIGPFGGYTSDAIAAIQYATDNGAKVVNASWGGGGFSLALKSSIEACSCVFVAAAGNDGTDNDVTAHYPSSYNSANLIAVAATDHNDNVASFSNFGATSVDLGAPGVSILSTVPIDSYDSFSGTSMATPHVSGVAGLIYSLSPGLTPVEVKDQILNGVDSIPALAGITYSGGRLNAANSLGATPPPPPNTPPTASITSPSDGSSFLTTDVITFDGSGDDAEDGPLSGASLVWTSDLDAEIGTSGSCTASLSAGSHTITLTATDSDGATGIDSVNITVNTPPPPPSADVVAITKAEYESGKARLKVEATSSLDGSVTLTATAFDSTGNILGSTELEYDTKKGIHKGKINGLNSAPFRVDVTSTAGGSDSVNLLPSPNTAPTASITSPSDGSIFLTTDVITFNGSGDDAEDGPLTGASLVWTSSVDAEIGTGGSFTASLSAGSHTITLTATDSDGATGIDSVNITVNTPPPPPNTAPTASIASPSDGSIFLTSDVITFDGSGDDAEDGALTGASLVWTSDLDAEIGTGGSFTASLSAGSHTITLTATDSDEATGIDSVSITVNTPPPRPSADVVAITKAEYESGKARLKVEATSSLGGSVTLTATAFDSTGNILGSTELEYNAKKGIHKGKINGLNSAPFRVDVTSTAGGSDSVEGSGIKIKNKKD